jgi:hypothetical protein
MTMASLPIEDRFAAPKRLPESEAEEARLSALEWSVVAVARRDGLGSLREPGRLTSALAGLFGRRGGRRAPNARLEALRRVAVLAWHHGWRVPTSELRAFLTAGFSLDQYELVQASIARGRSAGRSRRFQLQGASRQKASRRSREIPVVFLPCRPQRRKFPFGQHLEIRLAKAEPNSLIRRWPIGARTC